MAKNRQPKTKGPSFFSLIPKKHKIIMGILILLLLLIGGFFIFSKVLGEKEPVEVKLLNSINESLITTNKDIVITIENGSQSGNFTFQAMEDADTEYLTGNTNGVKQIAYIERIDQKKGIYLSEDGENSYTLYLKPYGSYIDDPFTDFVEADGTDSDTLITYNDATNITVTESDEVDEKGRPNPQYYHVKCTIPYVKAVNMLGNSYQLLLIDTDYLNITNFLQLKAQSLLADIDFTFHHKTGEIVSAYASINKTSLIEALNDYDRDINFDNLKFSIKNIVKNETDVYVPVMVDTKVTETINIATVFTSTGTKKNNESGSANTNDEELSNSFQEEETTTNN